MSGLDSLLVQSEGKLKSIRKYLGVFKLFSPKSGKNRIAETDC